MPDPLVAIRTYGSLMEAQIAGGLLESSGIDAVISADDCSSWHPGFHVVVGVKLLVPREQEEEARRLLDEPPPELPGEDDA